MKRVCLLVVLASFSATTFAQSAAADPSLCEGELEAIRRDHKRLRAQYDAMEADLKTRPTKKAHDKLVAAHDALRARFKNAPKKSSVARLERELEKAEKEIERLSARPTERELAKLRKRAEAAEEGLAIRPSAREYKRLQAAHERVKSELEALRDKQQVAKAIASVESSEGYDKVRWGMKPRSVKRAYKNLKESGDYLYLRKKIAARNAVVKFSFADKQLARVMVELAINGDDAVVAFNKTGKLLTKKYGAPKNRDKHWKDDRHKNEKAKWNTAVRNGDLVLTATWETEHTRVVLTTRGANGKAKAFVRYTSKELASVVDAETEKKMLHGL